jgi:hypothetical protein
MFKAHKEDTDEKNLFAENTARILLSNADLPLRLRSRACIILACSLKDDYLEMAEQAVRIAELCCSTENPVDLEKNLLRDCQTLLHQAQEVHDDRIKQQQEEEADDQEEQSETMVPEFQPVEQARPVKKVRKVPTGRVDSGHAGPPPEDRLEEWNEATGRWATRGPILEGEKVEMVLYGRGNPQ